MKNVLLLTLFAAALSANVVETTSPSSNNTTSNLVTLDTGSPTGDAGKGTIVDAGPSVAVTTPEPSTFALLGGGLLVAGLVGRRRR